MKYLLQAAPLEPAGAHERRGDEHDGSAASTQHGQVRLCQVRLRPRTVLPVAKPGDQARILPRVSVTRPLRSQHGTGAR